MEAKTNGYTNGTSAGKILPDVCHFVGHTPMIRMNRVPAFEGLECEVLAKCELFSAGGSHKDRIAVRMIEEAERDGSLKPGSTIVEATSGNTGVGVAMVCAVKGYKCILVMPEKMSTEKMDTMNALGATIIRTPNVPYTSPESSYRVAERLAKEIPGAITLNQYDNMANPEVHYDDTAEEILEQCGGKLDMVVIGAGTGGAITGIGRKMKERCPECIVVGVDPVGSIMAQPENLNEKAGQFWEIEGIGHDFLPGCLDLSVVDKWVKIPDAESLQMARKVISEEGLLVGGSSGSAVAGAIRAIKEAGFSKDKSKRVVVLIPDSIRNYMTKFLSDQWMLERDFFSTEEQQAKYSWWNKPLSNLTDDLLKMEETLSPETDVKTAIDIIKSQERDFAICTNEQGYLTGIVSLKTLLQKVVSMELDLKAPITKVTSSQFKRIPVSATIGKLTCTLSGNPFAIVVKPSEDNPKLEYPLGVVTQADLIEYLAHHQL